jgi:hypothetical protein
VLYGKASFKQTKHIMCSNIFAAGMRKLQLYGDRATFVSGSLILITINFVAERKA